MKERRSSLGGYFPQTPRLILAGLPPPNRGGLGGREPPRNKAECPGGGSPPGSEEAKEHPKWPKRWLAINPSSIDDFRSKDRPDKQP